jgi:hypothetical protein
MTFEVEPPVLRVYAQELASSRRAAEIAKGYINSLGSLSFHQRGLIGYLSPGHHDLMGQLNRMLGHLIALTDESDHALKQLAGEYEKTDRRAAAQLDATYPTILAAPSPLIDRD